MKLRKKSDPDAGSRIQGVKKHRIPDPQHWNFLCWLFVFFGQLHTLDRWMNASFKFLYITIQRSFYNKCQPGDPSWEESTWLRLHHLPPSYHSGLLSTPLQPRNVVLYNKYFEDLTFYTISRCKFWGYTGIPMTYFISLPWRANRRWAWLPLWLRNTKTRFWFSQWRIARETQEGRLEGICLLQDVTPGPNYPSSRRSFNIFVEKRIPVPVLISRTDRGTVWTWFYFKDAKSWPIAGY
jgi:hypothetical protein